jgi:TPR repeat protein
MEESLVSFIKNNNAEQFKFVLCLLYTIKFLECDDQKALDIINSEPDVKDNKGHNLEIPFTLFVLALYYAIKKGMLVNNIYYNKAISCSDANSLYDIGYSFMAKYQEENKIKKESKNDFYQEYGIKYWIEASNKNHNPACYSLGRFYFGTKKDIVKSEHYYRKGIENKCGLCAFELGNIYYKELKKYKEAKLLYETAITYNHIDAHTMLGLIYWKIEENYDAMKRIYMEGYHKGSYNSLIYLSTYYCNIEKDYNEGKRLLTMGVETGNPKFLCPLGDYYKNIEHDDYEANKYYIIAVIKNEKEGLTKLEENSTDKQLFMGLLTIKKKNKLIVDKINQMKDKLIIRALDENIIKNHNNLKDCQECGRQNVTNLKFNCGHEVCSYCFIDMVECPLRCFIKTNKHYSRTIKNFYKKIENN